jgi:23S rRNA (uracil1939-C5)-methyltransferase
MQNDNHTPDQSANVPPSDTSGGASDELQIESIVAGGDGIARHSDGFVVFVPRTAPGERVEVEYLEEHRQWRRARALQLIEKNPHRTDPPCPYYARCGGCQLQHLNYQDSQLPSKAAIISDSFRRIAKVEVEPPEVFASSREFGYRNRVSFVVARRGGKIVAGYHNVYDPSDLVDIDKCLLAEQPINDVWAALRRSWNRTSECLPSGNELRLTFRTNSNEDVGLAIEGGRGSGDPRGILEIADHLVAVWVLNRRGEIVARAGAQSLDEKIGAYTIPLVGTGFVQVNRGVAADLESFVREQCGNITGKRIVDAYCGFGLRALDFAQNGAFAVGIERDRYAIKISKQIAEQTGTQARLIAGDVERLLQRYLPADIVILNPPRRGVDRPAIDVLLNGDVARIIYVSCDPATLARDIQRLAGRFTLDGLRGFDLFPQTAHVETVATLKRVD